MLLRRSLQSETTSATGWMRKGFVALIAVAAIASVGGCNIGGDGATTTSTITVENSGGNDLAAKIEPDADPMDALRDVRDYYQLLDGYRFDRAWDYLPAKVKAEVGGEEMWKRGQKLMYSIHVADIALIDNSGRNVEVALSLTSKDVDACSSKMITQQFSGTWSFERIDSEYLPADLDITKVGGGDPATLSDSCGYAGSGNAGRGSGGGSGSSNYGSGGSNYGGYGSGGSNYGGYGGYGGGGDIDCDQISQTNIPVGPSDPNGLDADGDGIGCES